MPNRRVCVGACIAVLCLAKAIVPLPGTSALILHRFGSITRAPTTSASRAGDLHTSTRSLGTSPGTRLARVRLRNQPRPPAHVVFAIVIPISERQGDANLTIPCATSIGSVVAQTYAEWLAIIVGDGLSQATVMRLRAVLQAHAIPNGKVILMNMDASMRELSRYRYGFYEQWMFGGVNALNMGLDIAYSTSSVTHIARLDDDDVWLPDHLQNLVAAYTSFPNASFAFTQSSDQGVRESTALSSRLAPAFEMRPPEPCHVFHSSVSWAASHGYKYRQMEEQKQGLAREPRGMSTCCPMLRFQYADACAVLPADADLWERVHADVNRGRAVSVAVITQDVLYVGSEDKACILGANQSQLCFGSERLRRAHSLCLGVQSV